MAGDTRTIRVIVTGDSSSAQRAIKALHKDVKSTTMGMGGLGSFLGTWSKRAVIGLGAVAAGAGMVGLKTASNMQQARIGFTNMLGSATKADVMLKQLADFAAHTPFEFPELVKSSQRMMAMGFAAKDVIPTLTAVGDAVAAMGGSQESIQFITRALGQMQTKGKVTGEEVRQLAEQGIPVWKILAASMHKTTAEVMELSEEGKISASTAIPMLVKGIENGTAATQKFGGMMEAQSKTIQGRWSTLKDNVSMALASLAEKGFGPLGAAMSKISDAVENFMNAFQGKGPTGAADWAFKLASGIEMLYIAFQDGQVQWDGFYGWMQKIGVALRRVWDSVQQGIAWINEHKQDIITFLAVFGTAVTVFKVVTTAIRIFNAVLNMNPILRVVLALSMLITWLIRTYQTNAEFRAKVQEAWTKIKNVVKSVTDWWNQVMLNMGKTIEQMGQTWNRFATTVYEAWMNIKKWFAQGLKWVINTMLSFAISIVDAADTAFGWIPGIGDKLKGAKKQLEKFKTDTNKVLDQIGDEQVIVSFTTAALNTRNADNKRTAMQNRAYGGPVSGGIPGRDSVPSLLMPGEFVVRRDGSNLIDALAHFGRGMAAGGFPDIRKPSFAGMKAQIKPAVHSWAQQWANHEFSGSLAGLSAAGGVTRWASLVMRVLSELGQPLSLVGGVLRRIQMESGGNPFAINRWDSNAMAGHPSQGLMQTIPGTFAAYAGRYRALGILNPLASIYAGLNYAIHRYGSVSAIDPRVRPYGYDSGGMLPPGLSLAYNGTGKPEPVGHGLGATVNVYLTVEGSVVTERDLVKSVTLGVRDELIRHANRNGGRTGLPPQ
jgi:tape measure domain-containing protein